MATIKFRTAYDPHEPGKYAFAPVGESLTQQQFKDECNVNNIMAKYKKTGLLTHINRHQAQFGDFASIEDYQVSLHKLMQAQESFAQLPSEIRSKFLNDPANLIEFVSDPKNNEEAIKLGLKIPKPEKEPSFQSQMETALDNHEKKRTKKD